MGFKTLFTSRFLLVSSFHNRLLLRDSTSSLPRTVDPGEAYGSVSITNWCGITFYAQSVGAWSNLTGTDRSSATFTIPAGSTYHEPYRLVTPLREKQTAVWDPKTGKYEGQGISIKLTDNQTRFADHILQLEYALVQNPDTYDTFPRLNYDVSLLDCAKPPTEAENMTDLQSSKDLVWNQKKIDGCPGYQNGLALWFDNTTNCRPVYCDGKSYCDGIYSYDKTRIGEMSLMCRAEYRGDMHLEICVGDGNGSTAHSVYQKWASTGTTILGAPTPPSAGSSSLPKASASEASTAIRTDTITKAPNTSKPGATTAGPPHMSSAVPKPSVSSSPIRSKLQTKSEEDYERTTTVTISSTTYVALPIQSTEAIIASFPALPPSSKTPDPSVSKSPITSRNISDEGYNTTVVATSSRTSSTSQSTQMMSKTSSTSPVLASGAFLWVTMCFVNSAFVLAGVTVLYI